jgi:predicted acyltransferase
LLSLDALRGFDMFWIIGGAVIAHEAAKLTGWPALTWLSSQMEHAEWHGFTLYDLIFPLFLFIAGVAMPFSFAKRLERGDPKQLLYRHMIVRGLLLVGLGLIYNDILKFDWATRRYTSVLGRIGLAYMFAALIALNTKWLGQLLWAAGLLIAYWAALKFVPVPGYGAGDLDPGHTLTDYIDRTLMPGVLKFGNRDPLGILSTFPAIATALAGAITGHLLKMNRIGGYAKTGAMIATGFACLGLAYLWNLDFPINKNLWSSSFVLHCAGLSLLLLALFYLVVDVWRFQTLAMVFVVIGSNSVLIYMAQRFIDFKFTTSFFFNGALQNTGKYEPLLFAVAVVVVEWLLLLMLYKKRIFLRV